MTDADIINALNQALLLVLQLALPVIITASVVGVLVGLLQALTQIQDQTLPFALKLVAVVLVLALTVSWMGNELYLYSLRLFELIPLVA